MGFFDFLKKSKNVSILNEDISEHRKRIEKLSKKYEDKKSFNDIFFPFYNCIYSLLEIQRPYFTYVKHIDNIKLNLSEVVNFKNVEIYEKAKLKAIKSFKKDNNDIHLDINMKSLLHNPNEFLLSINIFHKKKLLDSVQLLYQYWISEVKNLKQKAAKKKRQQYVIEGYLVLKNELLKLKPSIEEIKTVDDMINKITNEDWTIL